ncbi:hypothetical protein JL722_14781 [Aureococcus anophagefferens]|nr:hypothetical protein JL722_14781 [Aureococcus anophagefferens]
MEPALPEETVTKNDVQKASSERVGPMDDVLDSEVPVEIVQKQSLLRKRLPAKTADAGTVEEIALAALEMKSHMEGEIQRLRLENGDAPRVAGGPPGRRAPPDPQGALSPTPPVPPPAKSPFKSPPFASPEALGREAARRGPTRSCSRGARARGDGVGVRVAQGDRSLSLEDVLELRGGHQTPAWAWKRGLRAVVAMLQRERALRFSEDSEQPQVDDDLSVRSVALASSRSGDSRDSRRLRGPLGPHGGAAPRRRASGASTSRAPVGAPRGPWRRDNAGKTPAHVLLETRGDGGRDVAVLLDAAGDDVLEARDDGGDVVLHVAARVGALRCARLLLQTACDPSPKNHDGLTPGDVARSKRDAAIANLIDEYGFDGEPTDFSAADDAPAPPLELFATAEGDEWQKLFCHDNQHPYYEHIASGHTQWEDPRADDGDGDGAALRCSSARRRRRRARRTRRPSRRGSKR